MIDVPCDLCGRPVTVRKRLRAQGRGRFHFRCSQIARTLGRKNPNYRRGERSYHSTRISRKRRAAIQERDGHRCVHCGRPSKKIDAHGARLDIHHILAVGDGGTDEDSNLCSLCRRCHNRVEHNRERLVWPKPAADSATAAVSGSDP